MIISKKYKLSVFLLLALAISNFSTAQIRISSPYSRYGFGDLQTSHSTYAAAMGGLSAALRHPSYINVNNPASYTAYDTNSFVLDVGINSTFNQVKTNMTTQGFTNHTSIGHVLFGFPVARWCGISFGILPYSKSGYQVKTSDTIINSDETFTESFKGSGGVNQAYIGVAFKPFKNFSFGANLGYLFGTIDKIVAIERPGDIFSFNTRVSDNEQVGGLYLNYGLQYQILLKKKYLLSLGTKFNLPMNVGARQTMLAERYSGLLEEDNISIKDTLLNIDGEKGKLHMPLIISGGFTLLINNSWLAGADFEWQNWKKFTSFGESASSLGNSYIISVGGEYSPRVNTITSYWKLINYRAGLRYAQSYYEIRDKKINDLSFSIGAGFPLPKTRTTLNLAVEAGTRGTVRNDLLKENYIRLVLGISFREFWFFRPKLN